MDCNFGGFSVAKKNNSEVNTNKDGNKYAKFEQYDSEESSNSCLDGIISLPETDEMLSDIGKPKYSVPKLPEFELPEIGEITVEPADIEPPVSDELKIKLAETGKKFIEDSKLEAAKRREALEAAHKPKKPEKKETIKREETVKIEKNENPEKEFDYSINDGIISPKDKVINFGKGLISPAVSMFESPENFIKGAGIIAGSALLIYATGGLAAPVLAGAGLAYGAFQFGKSAVDANKAKTDKEAENAWQGMGNGTSIASMSLIGAKVSSGKYSKINGENTEIAASIKETPKTVKTAENKTSAMQEIFVEPVKTAKTVSKTKEVIEEPVKRGEAVSKPKEIVEEPVKETVAKEEKAVDESIKTEKTPVKPSESHEAILKEVLETLNPDVSKIVQTKNFVLNNGMRITEITLTNGRKIFRY